MHFKLATRKSSSPSFNKEIPSLNNNEASAVKKIANDFEKEFDIALKEASKELDLNKRLKDLSINFEQSKLEQALIKLKDAESKNEYLTSIITQLQSKRSVNSGYRYILY